MSHAVVGIDPSTARLALVTTVGNRLHDVRTIGMPGKDRENTRAAKAYNEVLSFIEEHLLDDYGQYVYVFLEAPIYWRGGKATIPLAQMSGAVQAAVCNSGASLTMVHNSRWKKLIVGSGNAKKPDIAAYVTAQWPELAAEANGDQDILDAAAINIYGRRVLDVRTRVKAGLR